MSKVVLGKGLGALIPGEGSTEAREGQFRMISLDQIAPNPMQPRHDFEVGRLEELATSLKQNGVLQPLVVKREGSNFVIVAGERRYRAARLANLNEIPVVIIDDVDNTRMLELALIENIHRDDLNPIEKAGAYRRLMEECGLTQQELSDRIGKSRTAVANQLRLLTLPASIQDMIKAGKLTEGHARALLSLPTEEQMIELAGKIASDSLSVRDVEQRTKKKPRQQTTQRQVRPEIADIESQLREMLGTSVKIVPGKKRGRIEIEFYGEEDLDRIWGLLRKIAQ
jgi:ParB family chromosome partitioning protein